MSKIAWLRLAGYYTWLGHEEQLEERITYAVRHTFIKQDFDLFQRAIIA